MNSLSVIIPTYNEVNYIEPLLSRIQSCSSQKHIKEIIIVDGGSSDGTLDVLNKTPQIRVINSCKGRAIQLNTAAKEATGSVLYFIHADCFPPENFDSHILKAIEHGNLAGCFRLKFDSRHWWLRLAGWFTRFNWSICRGGDQSLFISKDLFNDIGCFDESYAVYEDNILIKTLYKQKHFVVLPYPISTSARRYQKHGIWKLQYYFWRIHLMHALGASANEIETYYGRKLKS